MTTYTKITFTGNFTLLLNSVQEKIPNIKLVQLNENSAVAIVDKLESIYNLKGQELQPNLMILSYEDNDYQALEIFLKHTSDRKKLESKEQTPIPVNSKSDPMTNLNNSLINTTLKSKSPLQPEDPFNYILSKGYLISTSIAISAFMLLSNIF